MGGAAGTGIKKHMESKPKETFLDRIWNAPDRGTRWRKIDLR